MTSGAAGSSLCLHSWFDVPDSSFIFSFRVTVMSMDGTVADGRWPIRKRSDGCDRSRRLYNLARAMQLLESVRQKLRGSFAQCDRLAEYQALEPYLGWNDVPAPYAELAARLAHGRNWRTGSSSKAIASTPDETQIKTHLGATETITSKARQASVVLFCIDAS